MTAYNPQAHFEIKTWDVEFRRTAQRPFMARIYQPQADGDPQTDRAHEMAKEFIACQLHALRKAA